MCKDVGKWERFFDQAKPPPFTCIHSEIIGVWLRGRLVATVVQHQLFFLGKINLAVVALKILIAASFRLQLPARNGKIKYCRAILAFFFSTVTNFPAAGKGQELLYPGNIEAVFMN